MVEHSARHLVFVNRSGVSKPQARESVQMLEAEGAAATFCGCDISDGIQTKEMLVTLARDAKPIRGLVQEAMLLRVGARSISLHHLVRFDLYAEVQTRSILLLLVCANWIPRIQDTYIERLTVDDYNAVVQAKLQGTWSLHHCLPRDLDFFVMLSLISGIIGNATQAAYAAGSSFMNAFDAYRNILDLPALTLDFGVIAELGYFSEI
jgi:hypothetical protein